LKSSPSIPDFKKKEETFLGRIGEGKQGEREEREKQLEEGRIHMVREA